MRYLSCSSKAKTDLVWVFTHLRIFLAVQPLPQPVLTQPGFVAPNPSESTVHVHQYYGAPADAGGVGRFGGVFKILIFCKLLVKLVSLWYFIICVSTFWVPCFKLQFCNNNRLKYFLKFCIFRIYYLSTLLLHSCMKMCC